MNVGVDAPEDEECPDAREALTACEGELAELTAVHPSTRLPSPDVPEAQQAGPWTEALADALTTCAIPASLEVTDCDEYPCAAALCVAPGDEARASAAWEACAPLQSTGVGLASHEVHCPDGSTETAYIAVTEGAMSTRSDVAAALVGLGLGVGGAWFTTPRAAQLGAPPPVVHGSSRASRVVCA